MSGWQSCQLQAEKSMPLRQQFDDPHRIVDETDSGILFGIFRDRRFVTEDQSRQTLVGLNQQCHNVHSRALERHTPHVEALGTRRGARLPTSEVPAAEKVGHPIECSQGAIVALGLIHPAARESC
jgi:hypothetical protein